MSHLEDKITKLLAKAEGTTNPHEAEAFMAKAEELMLENGIERAHLEAKRPGEKREDIIQVRIYIKDGHGYARAMVAIAHAIAPSFSVRSLQSKLPDGWVVWFVGHRSDVAQAETLFNSLMVQSHKQALHWWKTEGKIVNAGCTNFSAYLARREFIFAFASGVRQRLEETRNRVVEEAATGTDLVLRDRYDLVIEWIDENMDVSKARANNRSYGGNAAARAGKQAGRNAISTKELK